MADDLRQREAQAMQWAADAIRLSVADLPPRSEVRHRMESLGADLGRRAKLRALPGRPGRPVLRLVDHGQALAAAHVARPEGAA